MLAAIIVIAAIAPADSSASSLFKRVHGPAVSGPLAAAGGGVYVTRGLPDERLSVEFIRRGFGTTRLFTTDGPANAGARAYSTSRLVVVQATHEGSSVMGDRWTERAWIAVGRPGGRLRTVSRCHSTSIGVDDRFFALVTVCGNRGRRLKVFEMARAGLKLRSSIALSNRIWRRMFTPIVSDWMPQLSVDSRYVSLLGSRRGVLVFDWRTGKLVTHAARDSDVQRAELLDRGRLALQYDGLDPERQPEGRDLRFNRVVVLDIRSRSSVSHDLTRPNISLRGKLDGRLLYTTFASEQPTILFTLDTRTGALSQYATAPEGSVLPNTIGDDRIFYGDRDCWSVSIRTKRLAEVMPPADQIDCPVRMVEGSLKLEGREISLDVVCELGCMFGRYAADFGEHGATKWFSAAPGVRTHVSDRASPADVRALKRRNPMEVELLLSNGTSQTSSIQAFGAG